MEILIATMRTAETNRAKKRIKKLRAEQKNLMKSLVRNANAESKINRELSDRLEREP